MPPLVIVPNFKLTMTTPVDKRYFQSGQLWSENANLASNIAGTVAPSGKSLISMTASGYDSIQYTNLALLDTEGNSLYSIKSKLPSGAYGAPILSLDADGSGFFLAPTPQAPLTLTKFDASGTPVLSLQYTNGNSAIINLTAVARLTDGDLILAGQTYVTGQTPATYRAWIARISCVDGSIVWQYKYDVGTSLVPAGLAVIGTVIYLCVRGNSSSNTIVRIDQNGQILAAYNYADIVQPWALFAGADCLYGVYYTVAGQHITALALDGSSVLRTVRATTSVYSLTVDSNKHVYFAYVTPDYKTIVTKLNSSGIVQWQVVVSVTNASIYGVRPVFMFVNSNDAPYLCCAVNKHATMLAIKADGTTLGTWATGSSLDKLSIATTSVAMPIVANPATPTTVTGAFQPSYLVRGTRSPLPTITSMDAYVPKTLS